MSPPHIHDKEVAVPFHCLFPTAHSRSGGTDWVRSVGSTTETSMGPSLGAAHIGVWAPHLSHFRDWVVVYVGITGPSEAIPVVQATEPVQIGEEQEEYNPAFVAEILAADAAPPEEPGFNNVVDLLDWLNRD